MCVCKVKSTGINKNQFRNKYLSQPGVKEKTIELSVLKVKYDELAFYVKSLIGIAICDVICCNDEKFCVTSLTLCINISYNLYISNLFTY